MLGQDLTLSEAIEALKSTKKPPRLSVNGCILLKSMLSMPQSACRAITDGVVQLDKASVEFIAADPSGARVLETLLKVSVFCFISFHFPVMHCFSVSCSFELEVGFLLDFSEKQAGKLFSFVLVDTRTRRAVGLVGIHVPSACENTAHFSILDFLR